jgi:hypothetical protein
LPRGYGTPAVDERDQRPIGKQHTSLDRERRDQVDGTARVLLKLGADHDRVRLQVVQLLHAYRHGKASPTDG